MNHIEVMTHGVEVNHVDDKTHGVDVKDVEVMTHGVEVNHVEVMTHGVEMKDVEVMTHGVEVRKVEVITHVIDFFIVVEKPLAVCNKNIGPSIERKESEDMSSISEMKIDTGEAALVNAASRHGSIEQATVSLQILE